MEMWVMLNKLVVLIYMCSLIVKGRINNPVPAYAVIIMVLLYVIINVSKVLVTKQVYKNIFHSLSIVVLLISNYYISPLFFILIPIDLYEILVGKIKIITILFIIALCIFLTDYKTIICEYLGISLISLLAHYFILVMDGKINTLTNMNDKLKDKNYKLLINFNNQKEYNKQIVYTSQLQERNKIAQEIHDKLGHSISGSLMQLEAALLIMDIDNIQSKSIIKNTIDVLSHGMDSIRFTLKNIKPETEQLGISRIKLYIDEFSYKGKTNASLYYTNDLDRISYIEWKVIYDNLNEAFTNIIKYSQAKNVKVNIEVLNTLIKVEIKDDGVGCSKILKGLGLIGIEERTLNLNGKVIFDGSRGFSVIMLLPI